MNPEQLWETTIKNAKLKHTVKVKMDDAIKANEEISLLLMGDEVAPGRKFIEENAKYVKNLDV